MRRAWLSIVALLAAAVAAVAWLSWPRPAADPAPLPTAGAQDDVDASTAPAAAAGPRSQTALAETGEGRRVVVATTPGGPRGTLRVTALWPGDRPATGVTIYLRRRAEQYMPHDAFARGSTDEQGVVVFRGVEPGPARLDSDRGDRKDLDVVVGEQTVKFALKDGIAIRGTVSTPDGARVANAEVWLQTSDTTWTGGRVVATTDAVGEYAIEHVDPHHSIGAAAAGFAPSALVDLDVVDTSKPPVVVDLELRPEGGNIMGRVTDAAGVPVARAVVAVGRNSRGLDMVGKRIIERWTVRTAETAPDGSFALAGIGAGTTPVAILAEGYGLWRDDVTISVKETTTIAPRLLAAAVVHGRVTNRDGAPVVGAAVRAYDRAPGTSFLAGGQIDFAETFGYRGTIVGEDGSYWIEGITPGTVHLFAQRRPKKPTRGVSVAYARTEIEVAPGGDATWDAVIEDGRAIDGVVLYRDGFPIPNLFITLADESSGKQHVIVSDERGVFRFLCLQDSTYEIRVQLWDAPKGEPPLKATGVVPDRGRTELRTAYDRPVKQQAGTVVGRIDDIGRRIRNPMAAQVTLHLDDRGFIPGGQIENGAFRIERVTPCRFRLTLMEGDTALAHSGWFELQPAATVDTGMLSTEPAGAVRILASRAAGTEGLEPKLYLKRKDDPDSTTINLGRAAEHVADNLTPGDYEVTGYAQGMVALRATVAVTAGTTNVLRVDLRRGARCEFEIWWPEGPAKSVERSYRILDASGKVLQEYAGGLYNSPTRPYKLVSVVPPGRWKLEFSTNDGLSVVTEFEVPATFEDVKARLDLK